MANAEDVADYIRFIVDENLGDDLSNLKLQKLLYYCQGYFLAFNSKPLFEEEIVAWTYGPVVPCIYDKYKSYMAGSLPPVPKYEGNLNGRQKELIDVVYREYGQFSAGKLVELTHEETTWKETPEGGVISLEKMEKFFSDKIKKA
jgi:uncharacterized phage-associated protein